MCMSGKFEQYMTKYNFIIPGILSGRLALELWPIGIKPLVDNRLSEEHWHEHVQIWYTISGEYKHKINGVWYKQTPGSVAIIHPYSIHQIDSRASDLKNLNVISVGFPKAIFTTEGIPFEIHSYNRSSFDMFSLPSSLRLSGKSKASADILFEDALTEFRKQWDMSIKKICFNLATFLEICSTKKSQTISKKELLSSCQRFECINNAMSYIFENYATPLTLENISREAMMSQRSFTSACVDVVGQTCHNYVTATRMNNAIILLKRTNKSLDEIAEECGFYDRTHFIRLFKNYFRTTPTAWRDDFLKWKEMYEDYVLMSEIREHGWLRPDAVEYLKKRALIQA